MRRFAVEDDATPKEIKPFTDHTTSSIKDEMIFVNSDGTLKLYRY